MSSQTNEVSPELVQHMLNQREKRLKSAYAYRYRRYHEDEAYREKIKKANYERHKKRYAEDAEYRAAINKTKRESKARKKIDGPQKNHHDIRNQGDNMLSSDDDFL